jgi:NADPH:quinone reductase-like Zn-dependent oxidoreductase
MYAHGVIIESFDDAPHLERVEIPDLEPDQLLIRIRNASINAFDWKVADGRLRDAFRYDFPVTIGRDFSGVVDEVGVAVTRVQAGEAVFGYLGGQVLHRGSYASYLVCREDECFVLKPESLSFEDAACLPLCGIVAWRCVVSTAPVDGEIVLVIGAPGGAGSYAVQLAGARGAHVIATGLDEDREYLLKLGAADVLLPGDGLVGRVLERFPDGIDCLIDLVHYRPALVEHLEVVKNGGRVVSVHRAVDDADLGTRQLRGANVGSNPDPQILEELAKRVVAGTLTVPVTQRYALAEAVSGLKAAKEQHARGKFVIEMSAGGEVSSK